MKRPAARLSNAIGLTPKEQRVPWRYALAAAGVTVLAMFALWPIESRNVRLAGVLLIAAVYSVVMARLTRRARSGGMRGP